MFDFLNHIHSSLFERYLTVERNIKARTNSFYDSYLDLQEHFIKFVLAEQSFDIRVQETCGAILRKPEVRSYFLDILQIDEHTYNKMQDYTLKVNAHKHKGEKTIQVETIINYLRVFYDASVAYAYKREIATTPFDASYYIKIFGIFERENQELREEMTLLKEELSTIFEEGQLKEADLMSFQALLSQTELEKMSLEEQNFELQRQISLLKNIKLSSLEDKLNHALDLLLNLRESVNENRAITYAVGDIICGREMFLGYVQKAKESLDNGECF